ncbi:MAG: hypothetical protein CMI02_00790 [Oceanospirillaceae bacterium]|nr:hypothetical protein [Oceanospirillaceae bacterium]MBT10555.1 hypothetical protein [Oceanospirillaceae bacterium]
MQKRNLILSSLISAAALTGCGGDSSSSSDGGNSFSAYTDPGWSAGSDELVGLTYPEGAANGPLVALKRSDNGDGTFSHSLMLADAASKEFSDSGITLERDYYRDVLAVPVSVTIDGEAIDTLVVATCGYSEAGIADGNEPDPGNSSAQALAAQLPPYATIEFYVPGTDIADSVNIADDAALFSCYSLGGMTVADTADKGGSEYEVDFFVSGQGYEARSFVFEASVIFDYAAEEVTDVSATYDGMSFSITGAMAMDGDLIMSVNYEGDTRLFDIEADDFVLETAGNVFTSATDNGADILDLAHGGNDLFAVSADEGLAGGDFSGEQFVLLSGGDFEHCVDALAVNGSTLWCHDATDEGKLIEFTAPEVPQTPIVAAAARTVSDHSWTQIKAELEGAGAEVEVK